MVEKKGLVVIIFLLMNILLIGLISAPFGYNNRDLVIVRSGSLTELTDVNVPAPVGTEVLTYNSTSGLWEAQSSNGTGDITGVTAGTGLIGGGVLGDVTLNVSASTCGAGNVSRYNGTHFNCVVDTTGGGVAKQGDGVYLYNDSTTIYFNTTLAGTNLSVNSSDFWDDFDTANTTQIENQGGILHIIDSWLEGLIASVIGGFFDQDLNKTSNVTHANITADYFFGNGSQLIGLTLSETDPLWTNNQSLYYLVANPFDFWNSTHADFNETFADTKYLNLSGTNADQNISIGVFNLSTTGWLIPSDFKATTYHSTGSDMRFNFYDNGTDLSMNVSAASGDFTIEQDNSKIGLFNTPSSGNDFKVFQVFSKSGSDVTEFVITKAGVAQASYFVRSLAIAGNSTNNPTPFNCSTYANFIDCNTDTTGADFWVQDDAEINGTLYVIESINATDWTNVSITESQVSDLVHTPVLNTTCGGTNKISAFNNTTGVFTCTSDVGATETDPHWTGNQSSYYNITQVDDADNDTTYTNSSPINLTGTTFSLEFCADTEIYKFNATSGNWECEADDDSGAAETDPFWTANQTLYPLNTSFNDTQFNVGSNVTIDESWLDGLFTTLAEVLTALGGFFDQDLNTTSNVTHANITANFYFGNGSQLTGITSSTANSSDFWDNLDDPSDISGSDITNNLNWINTSGEIDPIYDAENGTIARIGDCAAGQFVQNTTTGGVECLTPSGTAYDLNISAETGSGVIIDSEIFGFQGSGPISTSITGNNVTITGTVHTVEIDPHWSGNQTLYPLNISFNSSQFTTTSNITINETWVSSFASGDNASWNQTLADTLYYDIDNNVLSYWNSTFALFNKTYADTLYYDIDNNVLGYWNSTFALFNKTYADTLYYDIDNNVLAYWNDTFASWNQSSIIGNITLTNGNLTADYLFGNGSQITGLTLTETDPLWTANSTLYPLNTSFNTTQFTTTGNITIQESWLDGLFTTLAEVLTALGGFFDQDLNKTSNVTHANITADYFFGNGSQLTGLTLTETDPHWTGNQSSYSTTSDIFSWNYWNDTQATFNKTFADTLYYDIDNNVLSYWNDTQATFNKTYADTLYAGITEPLWTGNFTNVAFTNINEVFTLNVTVETLQLEADDVNHYITDNATCVIIRGDTSTLEIC